MNNCSLQTADRMTHVKIMVLALIAGIIVVGMGIAVRPIVPDISTQLKARVPVLNASGPVISTSAVTLSVPVTNDLVRTGINYHI
jgi:hypothetical protein